MRKIQNRTSDSIQFKGIESQNNAEGSKSSIVTELNPPADAPASTLNAEAISELIYIIQEEKLAGDIYEAFYEQTGLKAFDRIAASEDRHMDALVRQAQANGVDVSDILLLTEGVFQDETLQTLYDDLLAQGSQSLTAALEVGVMIETKDIVDLEVASESVDGAKLADVYDALLAGSQSHLDAFESLLG